MSVTGFRSGHTVQFYLPKGTRFKFEALLDGSIAFKFDCSDDEATEISKSIAPIKYCNHCLRDKRVCDCEA